MLKSVYENGGFYIGEYETGIEEAARNLTLYVWDGSANDGDGDYVQANLNDIDLDNDDWYYTVSGPAVIKQNVLPYNGITLPQAEVKAETLATGGKEASLLFGLQWDLVLKHLSNKEVATNLLTGDSHTWGNYYDTAYEIPNNATFKYSINYGATFINDEYSKTNSESVLLTTGAYDSFSKFNIYDLAGNVEEWTLEYTSDTNNPCAVRGGNFNYYGSSFPASLRYYYNTPMHSDYRFGFRTSLY